jgi:hypothetical protein
MSTPLATLFTKIGFDIDTASLNNLNKQISGLESKFKGLAKSFNSSMNKKMPDFNAKVRLTVVPLTAAQKKLPDLTVKVKQKLVPLGGSGSTTSSSVGTASNATLKAIQSNTGKVAGYQHILAKDSTLRRLITATNRANRTGGTGSAAAQRLALQRSQQEHATQQLRNAANLQTLQQRANDAAQRLAQNSLNHTRRMELQNLRRQTQQDRLTHNTNQNRNRGGGGSGGIAGMGINAQTAIGAVAGGGFMQSAFKMANFAASQPVQYEFITGSKEKAGEQIEYVNGLTDQLKLDLVETDTAYKQFLGATESTIGTAKTQEVFTGVQKLGIMMGASSDQMKRGSKAIIQMLSKQKLSAEELTGTKVPDHLRNRVMRTYLMREALRA